jgi:hypothetical protein
MAKSRRKSAVNRFASGGDLDTVEQEVLDAIYDEAVRGNASAARIILGAVKERRKALELAKKRPEGDGKPALDENGLPILKIRREAI